MASLLLLAKIIIDGTIVYKITLTSHVTACLAAAISLKLSVQLNPDRRGRAFLAWDYDIYTLQDEPTQSRHPTAIRPRLSQLFCTFLGGPGV